MQGDFGHVSQDELRKLGADSLKTKTLKELLEDVPPRYRAGVSMYAKSELLPGTPVSGQLLAIHPSSISPSSAYCFWACYVVKSKAFRVMREGTACTGAYTC
jgi:hypothetical protein